MRLPAAGVATACAALALSASARGSAPSGAVPVSSTASSGAGEPASAAVTGPPSGVCEATLARPPGLARPLSADPAGWVHGTAEVDLRGVAGVDQDSLFEALSTPGAEGLEALDLSGQVLAGAGKALGAVSLPALKRLWVEDAGLGEVGLRGLFAAEGLSGLQVLDASGAGLEANALAALVGSPLLATLRSLDLRDSEVTGAAVLTALAGAGAKNLVCVAVSGPVPEAAAAAWSARGVTVVVGAP